MKLLDPGPSRKGWHRLQNALKCPRYAAWSARDREQGSEQCPSPSLIKGSLMHIGLAHHYHIKKYAPIAEKALEAAGVYIPKSHLPYEPHDAIAALAEEESQKSLIHKHEWMRHVPEVQKALECYLLHWRDEPWVPRAIEHELETVIKDGDKEHLYTQRVDAIFTHPMTGKHWFFDHKTTFRIQNSTTKRYTLSGQFLGYNMLGKRIFKERYGGVMLNMIGWGDKKKGPQFQRVAVPAAPYSQERFIKTLLHAEHILEEYEGRDPGEWPGAHHETVCWGTYGPCKYFDRCHYGE